MSCWDFVCRSCGRRYADVPYSGSIPKSIKCTCGKCATWARQRVNYIHPTHSGRKYGLFDPQFGCVVESYDHKQRLLRENNLVESPPLSMEEAMDGPLHAGSTAKRDPEVVVADSMEEIHNLIPQDRVDRKKSGRKRDNLDFWGGF